MSKTVLSAGKAGNERVQARWRTRGMYLSSSARLASSPPGMFALRHKGGVTPAAASRFTVSIIRRLIVKALQKVEVGPVFSGTPSISITASRSEEHTSELQSLMRISYAVFCLKKKTTIHRITRDI